MSPKSRDKAKMSLPHQETNSIMAPSDGEDSSTHILLKHVESKRVQNGFIKSPRLSSSRNAIDILSRIYRRTKKFAIRNGFSTL